MYCKNCGAALDDRQKFCHSCGQKTEPVQGMTVNAIVPAAEPPKKGNGLAIAGFVLSLASLVNVSTCFICSILAVVFSSIGVSRARKRLPSRKGFAIAGLVIGISALSLQFLCCCLAIMLY